MELRDQGDLHMNKPYFEIYEDLRASMDQIHKDDSLKSVLLKSPSTYIQRDPGLAATLQQFRTVGKKLFLLTNSEWYYTDHVMRYLLDGEDERYASWRDYFDVIISFACKPSFFSSNT